MIRASASAALPRPTAYDVTARRPLLLVLLLVTMFALVGTAVGQSAAAAERTPGDEIWVNADGVTFDRGRQNDEVAYVVRAVGSRDEQAFSRELTRDEQTSGWAAFREAREAYPNGYCVVSVEVGDAGTWRETGSTSACNATEPTPKAPATKKDERATPTPTPTPTPVQPTPTPTPTPSPSPSATPSDASSPSPSHTSPEAALMQNLQNQPPVAESDAAAEQGDVISPLGWVAVLGGGVLLTTGGVLVLWRRLT
ncbi:hypothetical protein [Promicromonospora soli]